MPKANQYTDEWCAGIAGGIASWGIGQNATQLASPAGGTSWLNKDWVIFQYCPNGFGCSVIAVNVRTNERKTIEPNGVSTISANGGVWALWGDGHGFRDSLGRGDDLAGICPTSVGPDGAIAVKNRYYSFGPWTVWEQNGEKWSLTGGTPDDADSYNQGRDVTSLKMLGNRRASWVANGEPRVIGEGVPLPNPLCRPFWWGQLVETSSGWLYLYQAVSGALLLQIVGSTLGWIVAPPQDTFQVDYVVLPNTVRVFWSTSPGESPWTVRVQDIDIQSETQDLTDAAQPPLIFTFNHPVIIAPFKDPQGLTMAPMEILVNQNGQTKNRPCFAASDTLHVPMIGPLEGIYTEASDPTDIINLANDLNTRVLVCHDTPADWIIPSGLLRSSDIPMLECYPTLAETPAQSGARWKRQMQALLAVWTNDIGLVLPFYCFGQAPPNELFTVAYIKECLRMLNDVWNLSPQIKVLAPFEFQRANGITAHVELLDAFTDLLSAAKIAGLAVLKDVETMVRPGIQITKYDSSLKKGQQWELDFSLGGQTKVTVRIDMNGDLWVTSANAAGSDATGLKRHVEVE